MTQEELKKLYIHLDEGEGEEVACPVIRERVRGKLPLNDFNCSPCHLAVIHPLEDLPLLIGIQDAWEDCTNHFNRILEWRMRNQI